MNKKGIFFKFFLILIILVAAGSYVYFGFMNPNLYFEIKLRASTILTIFKQFFHLI